MADLIMASAWAPVAASPETKRRALIPAQKAGRAIDASLTAHAARPRRRVQPFRWLVHREWETTGRTFDAKWAIEGHDGT
jgi:hypothetical protein